MKKKDTSRRNFLKLGLTAGVGAIAGTALLSSCSKEMIEEPEEKVKLLGTDGKLVEVNKSAINSRHKHTHGACDLSPREGIPNKKFVMVIDLSRCRNARKCVEGCQEMHFLPPHHEWIKVFLMQDSEEGAPYWFPKPCLHCNNPPCVKVCPVGATFKRTDGIVLIDNERCIGCKFCMAACPFSSRVFNWEEPVSSENMKGIEDSPETSIPQKMGTVGKCDFCPDMARQGILPKCITSCPNGVLYFGDKNEDAVTNGTETLRFSKLIEDRAGYRLMEELGTQPNVYYLPPVNRLFEVERGLENLSEEDKEKYKTMHN